jgi:hypothetical protein
MAFNGPAWLMGILFASEGAKPTSGQIRIVGDWEVDLWFARNSPK